MQEMVLSGGTDMGRIVSVRTDLAGDTLGLPGPDDLVEEG